MGENYEQQENLDVDIPTTPPSIDQPIESIPETLRDWIEIDRRVDLIGRGDKVHDLSRLKSHCFEWWQLNQKTPNQENIISNLKMGWKTLILEIRDAERVKKHSI